MATLQNLGTVRLRLRLGGDDYQETLHAVQGDTGRVLEFDVLDGDGTVVTDLTGVTPVLFVRRPDGKEVGLATGEIVGGVIRITIPSSLLAHAGETKAQIQLVDSANQHKLHDHLYRLRIEESLEAEASPGENLWFSLAELTEAIAEVHLLVEQYDTDVAAVATMCDDVTSKHSEVTTMHTSLRDVFDTEQERQTAESARISAETDRVEAENNRRSTFETLEEEYAPKLTAVTAQLAQNVAQLSKNTRGLSYYWKPEPQPAARKDQVEAHFIDGYAFDSDYFINNHMEPLRISNPDYITRKNLGKDQSGEYDIWRYDFTPAKYTKTIIINTCIHGSEVTPAIAMVRFLHYLVNEWEEYPLLAQIREDVRIIYVPMSNPWGVSQSPRSRQNSRGVNINQNWSYKWEEAPTSEPFSHQYKGTEPFSEIETRILRDTILEFDDAVAYLDLHNTGVIDRDFYVLLPDGSNQKTYDKLLDYFTRNIENPDVMYGSTTAANGRNFAYHELGMYASTPEWCDNAPMYGAVEVQKSLEWFANIIIEHCREFDTRVRISDKTITNQIANAGLNNTTNWSPITMTGLVADDGILTARGPLNPNSTVATFVGDLKTPDFQKGDYIYLSGEMQVPENCRRIYLRLRDYDKDINYVVASVENPESNKFIKLSGVFKVPEDVTLKYQLYSQFSSGEDILDGTFKLTKPILINVKNDLNVYTSKEEVDQILKQIGGFFIDDEDVTLINGSVDRNILELFDYFINKINP